MFLTFRRFKDPTAAKEFIHFLQHEEIQYELEDASPQFDVTFANNPRDKEVHIKLLQSDFSRVKNLLAEREKDLEISDMPADYYLLQFSDEELMEILIKPDEWNAIDYNLSQKILKNRGKEVNSDFLAALKKERNETLSLPEKSEKSWIYTGYVFALLGGLLGLFIGWHLMTFKKTLSDGTRVYGYVASDRKNGRYILIIGIVFAIINLIFWLYALEFID